MIRLTRIIEPAFLPLALAFLAASLLRELGLLHLPAGYGLLGYILPLLAVPGLSKTAGFADGRPSMIAVLLFASLVFASGMRFLPLVHSPVPLGYDPGFYRYTLDLYFNALPELPESGLAPWVRQMFEQGFFVLADVFRVLPGLDVVDYLNYVLPLFAGLLALVVFVLTRSLFGPVTGAIAALLYAVSYTQYTAFTLFYLKNVIGLIFLLLAMYALEKKKDGLMALMFAALGIFHRPEFLLFALILVPYFFFHRRRGMLLAALGTGVLIAPFWIPRWDVYWGTIAAGIGSGTMFDFTTYTLTSMAYLPFAVIGFVYLVASQRWNSVLFYFAITCIIVVFQLFFFNRYIIMLDLALIVLAAAGINHSLMSRRGIWKAAGAIAVALIFLVAALPTITESRNISPRIDAGQLQALLWINENAERDAYVLATSRDAPWALGWSGRRVIAPGLFEWSAHDKEAWFEFIESEDPALAREFLDVYPGPVYIYYSRNPGNFLPLEKFRAAGFQEVYPGEGAVVYRYQGGT
ncbi:MAG: glycosyltransferase family 39 protein [Chloroflexi bacterium]|nr:glycosyltransferase family 39 protein [Chloroflexota bacterium]